MGSWGVWMKGFARHKVLYGIFRFLLGWLVRLKFRYSYERIDYKEPFLLVCNHTTNWDPLFLGIASKQHIYFVASEHLFRIGWVSKLLDWALHPIARRKGATDAQSAMTVIRTVRKGANVCLFAEGNRSYNGLTCPVYAASGKLVQSTGTPLITYKLKGGYFSNPRWGKTLRRGVITGEIVNIYTARQLKEMTTAQVDAILQQDLFEDAYARQKDNPVAFRGKRLAEYIETAMYICPRCGAVGTIESEDNRFWCTRCDMQAIYTEYGMLEGEHMRFSTITDWDLWQTEQLPDVAATLTREHAIRDGGAVMRRLGEKHRSEIVGEGTLALYADRLVCGGMRIPISAITDMALVMRNTLLFSANGVNYEIVPRERCCARKYYALYAQLKNLSDM